MTTRPWPPTNATRVAFEGVTSKNVPWANIMWLATSISGNLVPADLTTVAANMYTAFATSVMPILASDVTFKRCVLNYYGVSPTQFVADHVQDTPGGSDNATEVDSLSACLSWTIPQTWRGGKPRTYLAGLPSEAFEDSNTLAASFITAAEAAGNALRTATLAAAHGSLAETALGTVSFYSANAPRTPPLQFVYSGCVVHPRIDSMRRRLGREIS